jgi:hypothetical protein
VPVSAASSGPAHVLAWTFGGWKNFGHSTGAPVFLALALLVVLALVVMNTVIVAVAATRAVTQAKPAWPSNALVEALCSCSSTGTRQGVAPQMWWAAQTWLDASPMTSGLPRRTSPELSTPPADLMGDSCTTGWS